MKIRSLSRVLIIALVIPACLILPPSALPRCGVERGPVKNAMTLTSGFFLPLTVG
jgi:hypothetical protein